MTSYKLSNEAKEDLIRIHQYGCRTFGIAQADRYFDKLFEYFEAIAKRPYAYEAVDHLKKGYRRCTCGTDSIYFRVSEDGVDIMAIVGRQDLENIL